MLAALATKAGSKPAPAPLSGNNGRAGASPTAPFVEGQLGVAGSDQEVRPVVWVSLLVAIFRLWTYVQIRTLNFTRVALAVARSAGRVFAIGESPYAAFGLAIGPMVDRGSGVGWR
jgi:hypothetical protein